jgi:hypothetical protein
MLLLLVTPNRQDVSFLCYWTFMCIYNLTHRKCKSGLFTHWLKQPFAKTLSLDAVPHAHLP